MRKTIIAAAAVLALGGGAGAALTAAAQPAPGGPAEHMDGPMDHMGGGMGGPGGGPMGEHMGGPMGGGFEGRPMMGMHPDMMHEHMMHHRWRLGALIVPAENRNLSGADVQAIAQAFLLWNGNHTWKVTEVAENPDNTVGFAYASQSGDVIARYRMDRRTGHVERVS